MEDGDSEQDREAHMTAHPRPLMRTRSAPKTTCVSPAQALTNTLHSIALNSEGNGSPAKDNAKGTRRSNNNDINLVGL